MKSTAGGVPVNLLGAGIESLASAVNIEVRSDETELEMSCIGDGGGGGGGALPVRALAAVT